MRILRVLVASMMIGAATPAVDGVFGDDLQRCLVTKMTDQDRTTMMRWMLSVISSDPQLKPLTTFTEAERIKVNNASAQLIQKLAIDECHDQAIAAVKQEGPEVLGAAFNVLGQSAARQMFASPAAKAELEKLGNGFDKAKFEAFMKEAGIAPKDSR